MGALGGLTGREGQGGDSRSGGVVVVDGGDLVGGRVGGKRVPEVLVTPGHRERRARSGGHGGRLVERLGAVVCTVGDAGGIVG